MMSPLLYNLANLKFFVSITLQSECLSPDEHSQIKKSSKVCTCIQDNLYKFFSLLSYSLKFSRTKIFVDFVVFKAPMKILSTKFSAYITCKTCYVC